MTTTTTTTVITIITTTTTEARSNEIKDLEKILKSNVLKAKS
jgi:hypothetical protein